MTLRTKTNPRLIAVKKLDGTMAIGLQGERRAHPRLAGAFKAAEDNAYGMLRKIKPTKAEERAERAQVLRELSKEGI